MSEDRPIEPSHHQAASPRGTDGRYVASPETAVRDARAAELRGKGWSYRRIAAEIGYADHTGAMAAVKRSMDSIRAEGAAEARQLELDRLDALTTKAMEVLERQHLSVSQGRVVRQRVGVEKDENGEDILDGDGKPIPIYEDVLDDGPALQAIDRLLKIQERRAKLLGLDAPAKAEVGGKLSYEIVGINLDQL